MTPGQPSLFGALTAHANLLLAFAGGAVLIAAVLAAKAVLGRLGALFKTGFGASPFVAREVMNKGEAAMYRRLLAATPQGCIVLAQVQLSGFLAVRGLSNKDERWKYLNRIVRLSLDFLIVDADTMMPLAGIELDGASHEGGKAFMSGQKDADLRKDQAMKSAKLPLLRLSTRTKASTADLRRWLSSAVGR